MTSSHFLRVKRLSKRNHIAVAAKHNLRELQSERGAEAHIDATRSQDNQVLYGERSASGVKDYTERLTREAGVLPLRKNAMRAFEIVISLPIASTINKQQYFDDSLRWAKSFFGVPVISAVVHLDESAPHLHVLMLPLLNGKMQGDKVVGNRSRMIAMQESFYRSVGQSHGLHQPKQATRLDSATRQKAAELFYNAIVDEPELLLKTEVESAVMTAYSKNPEPLLASIGLSIPTRPHKSMAEIMCKPCKAEFPTYPRISFSDPVQMTNPYVSVGLPQPPSLANDHNCSSADTDLATEGA
jgi:hypothetical protein